MQQSQRSGNSSSLRMAGSMPPTSEYAYAEYGGNQRFDKSRKKVPVVATKAPQMYPGSHSPSPVGMDGEGLMVTSSNKSSTRNQKLEPQDPQLEYQMQMMPKTVVSTDVERSNSAPPVLVTSESIFAFRADEYKHQPSTDIRCQDNYYEYYYSSDKKDRLPPPLETQPFLVEKSTAEGFGSGEELEGPKPIGPISTKQSKPSTLSPFYDYRYEAAAAGDIPTGLALNSPALNETSPMWSPLPKKVASSVLDDFYLDDSGVTSPELKPQNTSAPPQSLPVPQSTTQNQHFQISPPQITVQQAQPIPSNLVSPQILIEKSTSEPLKGEIPYQGSTFLSQSPESDVEQEKEQEEKPTTRSGNPDRRPRCKYFFSGYCGRGQNCQFSHEAPEGRSSGQTQIQTQTQSASSPPPQPSSSPPVSSGPPAISTANGRTGTGTGSGSTGTHIGPPWNRKLPPEEVLKQFPPISELVGRIYQLCQDQFGCRYLQKQLDEGDEKVQKLIFTELVDHMSLLMADPFGNYLAQKVLEHATDWQRFRIIQVVGKDLERIACNMHGTRAVQRLIEYLKNPDEILLIRDSLRNSIVRLIQDLNGNHVIQRCLHVLSFEDKQFIFDAVTEEGHIIDVATHRHGCCVLQRCIDHASEQQKMQLVSEIINCSLQLVQDPFGNYVVQYVLELPIPNVAKGIATQIHGHIAELSMQKFSSNVMEKLVLSGDVDARNAVIKELSEWSDIGTLLQDPFANYVVQTALSHADPTQHTALVERINPHLAILRNTPYGKRIQTKIMKEGTNAHGGSPSGSRKQHHNNSSHQYR